jgi:hypothetical protein
MTNPHFAVVTNWKAAQAMLDFEPREPTETAGHRLQSLQIHIRDHRLRELPIGGRTLEARRLALDVSYGADPQDGRMSRHAARLYDHGPELRVASYRPRRW